MKRCVLMLMVLGLVCACNRGKYRYVEMIELKDSHTSKPETLEKDIEIFNAASDSAAFVIAVQKFWTSYKTKQALNEQIGFDFDKTVSFKLYNSNEVDIAQTVKFNNKEQIEEEIKNSILNSALDSVVVHDKPGTNKVDSAKIKLLLGNFRKQKDEFEKTEWCFHKTSPAHVNANGLYCYFGITNNTVTNFRFVIQYYAEDWLFIQTVKFLTDDKNLDYTPNRFKTDSGDGGKIWEWSDEPVNETNREIIQALQNATSAKMKLIGNKYYNIKPITSTQLKAIRETIELYEAMGGTY